MQYDTYTSWEEGHTRDEGGGMDAWPAFQMCDARPSMFGDLFEFDNMHRCRSIEDVMETAGIIDYHRFICGFHLRGMGKSMLNPQLCPLDWYYQSASQRLRDPDVWEHYLLLDQASPGDFWKSVTVSHIGQYHWPNHRIGADAA